jgi:ABC-2 type transport system ATP-binding protein
VPGVVSAEASGTTLHLALADAARDTPAAVAALVRAGAEVLRVGEDRHSLEDVYLELMKGAAS